MNTIGIGLCSIRRSPSPPSIIDYERVFEEIQELTTNRFETYKTGEAS